MKSAIEVLEQNMGILHKEAKRKDTEIEKLKEDFRLAMEQLQELKSTIKRESTTPNLTEIQVIAHKLTTEHLEVQF